MKNQAKNKETFVEKLFNSPRHLAMLGGGLETALACLQLLLFAQIFPYQEPAHLNTVGSARLIEPAIFYSENCWYFLLILQLITLIFAGLNIAVFTQFFQRPLTSNRLSLLKSSVRDLKRALSLLLESLSRLDPRVRGEKPNGEHSSSSRGRLIEMRRPLSKPLRAHLTQQLQGNISRLEVVNAHYRDSSRIAPPGAQDGLGKSDNAVVPLSIAQVLNIRDLTSGCLYRATSDHRQLNSLREEAGGFCALYTELHQSLEAQLKMVHSGVKTQRLLWKRMHEGEGLLTICAGVVSELQQKISLLIEYGSLANVGVSTQEALPGTDICSELMILQEKCRILASKFQHLSAQSSQVKKSAGEINHLLGNVEVYHGFYTRKILQLEQASGEFSQGLGLVTARLNQRCSDLADLADKLTSLEFTGKELELRHQQALELGEHYRRTIHEHQVVTIHCEQALRALVKSLGNEALGSGLSIAAIQHLDELQLAQEQLRKVFG